MKAEKGDGVDAGLDFPTLPERHSAQLCAEKKSLAQLYGVQIKRGQEVLCSGFINVALTWVGFTGYRVADTSDLYGLEISYARHRVLLDGEGVEKVRVGSAPWHGRDFFSVDFYFKSNFFKTLGTSVELKGSGLKKLQAKMFGDVDDLDEYSCSLCEFLGVYAAGSGYFSVEQVELQGKLVCQQNEA